MEYLELSNGVEIPQIGQGVFRLPDDEITIDAVLAGLEAGFRHIDTAAVYKNERATGEAVRRSGIKREELFITSKLWNDDIRARRTREAYSESLERLGLDYLDLYLIHWPADGFEEAWCEMEKLYKEGRVRAIGVSNFHLQHLEKLKKTASIKPFVEQIESHPYFNNQKLIDYLQKEKIVVEVWSPLGGSKTSCVRDDALLAELGKKYGKSTVQIILRWDIQRGLVALPKSTHKVYLKENLDVFDFVISDEDMQKINNLTRNMRIGSDPDNFNF